MSVRDKLRRALAGAIRTDSWVNVQTGQGLAEDKVQATRPMKTRLLSEEELGWLFEGDSLAYRVVTTIVDEAMRQGFKLKSESNQEAADDCLKYAQDYHDLQGVLTRTCHQSRLYGGVGLFHRVADGTEWTDGSELDLGTIQEYLGCHLLRPSEVHVQEYSTDLLSRDFCRPLYYSFPLRVPQGTGYHATNIHCSRLTRVEHGVWLDETILDRDNYGFPLSVLTPVYERIRSFRAASGAVDALFADASQSVYKIRGLLQILQQDGGDEMLLQRFSAIDQMRSGMRAILLDSEGEDFSRVATPLAEFANLLDRLMLSLAEAAGMPVTKLFGQSPAGLSSSGEAETKSWYDTVRAYQETHVEPLAMDLLQMVCQGNEAPELPEDVSIVWPSLWQLTPVEQAQVKLTTAQTDVAYINALVFDPEAVAEARSKEDGWMLEIEHKTFDTKDFFNGIDLASGASSATAPGGTGAEAPAFGAPVQPEASSPSSDG